MRKTQLGNHLSTVGLCACLTPLLRFELQFGNKIVEYNRNSTWPKKGSHLIILKYPLQLKNENLPQHDNVSVEKNNNPHDAWYSDAYCNVHHHFIMAG